jgi:TRAP-type C4-dicarboxylate transport system permease small subunit
MNYWETDWSSSWEETYMKLLKWLNNNLERSIGMILMAIMSILVFLQVVMRRIFNNSLTWSEELARYTFIWMLYIGTSQGVQAMKHIKIEAFLKVFPRKCRSFVEIIGDILFLCLALIIIYTSFEVVQKQAGLGQTTAALRIPMSVIYAAPLGGFSLVAFRQIQLIIYRIKILKTEKTNG